MMNMNFTKNFLESDVIDEDEDEEEKGAID
jgi:hypothetical protein